MFKVRFFLNEPNGGHRWWGRYRTCQPQCNEICHPPGPGLGRFSKGLRVAATLRQVADAAIDFRKVGLIVIRLRNEAERSALSIPVGLDCL